MKKSILIYDDEADILMVCKIILEKNNFTVETRSFCDNIIKDISNVKPDIILMDLWIPSMGGENAIKLMKNNTATMHIPVILFSANAHVAVIAERVNANGFLLKPFDIPVFLETIKNTLTEKKL